MLLLQALPVAQQTWLGTCCLRPNLQKHEQHVIAQDHVRITLAWVVGCCGCFSEGMLSDKMLWWTKAMQGLPLERIEVLKYTTLQPNKQ